jgi:hypothetical protein
MTRRLCSLLLACSALAACATYRTQRLGVIEPWPLQPSATLGGVSLRLYGNLRYEGGPAEMDLEQLVFWREQALRAYRESGIFRGVASGFAEGDLVAEIAFIVRTVAPRSQDAGSLGSQQRDLIMRTRFRDREGRSLGSIDVSEAVRSYSATLLLPFASEQGAVVRQVVYDLHRATLKRALEQGMLRPAAPKREGETEPETDE